MKKILSILLVVCLSVNMYIPSVAAESVSNNIVTLEEWENAIKIEGKKYGIECDVLDYDPSIILTKDMLEKALTDIKDCSINTKIEYIPDITPIQDASIDSALPYLMPVTKDVYKKFRITNVYGYAYMRLDANVTVNVQYGNIMQVNSKEVYQSGGFVNFSSWTTQDIVVQKEKPSLGWVTFTVTGRAVFQYADPFTGITTGYTVNVNEDVEINCN